MAKRIIIIGGGGHCKSVIDVAEQCGYEIIGIIDRIENVGKIVLGYPIIGIDDDIPSFVNKGEFIIAIGQIENNKSRKRIAQIISNSNGKLATLVAKDAYVSKYAQIGEGSVVMHNAFVNAGAQIGQNCIINTNSIIEHDVKVGNFCHISTGTIVNGEGQIGDDCFLGSNSVINQNVRICQGVVVASLSVVVKDIVEEGVYIGVPVSKK